MTFRISHCRALLLAIFVAFNIGFSANAADAPRFQPGRVLIIPKAGKAAEAANLHKQKGRHVAKKFPAIKNLEVVDLPAGQDVLATVKEYLDSGLVETAEPDYFLYK